MRSEQGHAAATSSRTCRSRVTVIAGRLRMQGLHGTRETLYFCRTVGIRLERNSANTASPASHQSAQCSARGSTLERPAFAAWWLPPGGVIFSMVQVVSPCHVGGNLNVLRPSAEGWPPSPRPGPHSQAVFADLDLWLSSCQAYTVSCCLISRFRPVCRSPTLP